MKAAVYRRYGPPDVVHIVELPVPEPGNHEILIRVHAATVNRTDTGFRTAEYVISRLFSGLFKPKYPVPGCEFAGEVVKTGDNVTAFRPGDRVFGFNDTRFGSHAEYMVVAETDALALVPDGMDYITAAALTEGSHYALCNIRAAGVKTGSDVLVNGATGAIGSAAVQLLKYFGAQVTAVCHEDKVPLVQSLGANDVIDYTTQDFTQLNRKFDFVFDAVGKSSFGKCRKLLKPRGVYISTELGKYGENIWLALLSKFSKGKKLLFPLPTISKDDVDFIRELAVSGKFTPVIDRVYEMNQIVDAHRYVESGMKTGNVVVKIAGN